MGKHRSTDTIRRDRGRIAGGVLVSALASGALAVGALSSAGTASATCYSSNGVINIGSGCTTTAGGNTAFGYGPGATATAQGVGNYAYASGTNAQASALGVGNQASATGTGAQATAVGSFNSALAIGNGAAPTLPLLALAPGRRRRVRRRHPSPTPDPWRQGSARGPTTPKAIPLSSTTTLLSLREFKSGLKTLTRPRGVGEFPRPSGRLNTGG
jgi:hypothetical protein